MLLSRKPVIVNLITCSIIVMTDEQIELLRFAIRREIEYLSIDGIEHGAWVWAEQVADERWKEFQESFNPVEIDGIKKEQALATLESQ